MNRTTRYRRQGYVMVLFAMMLFGLMAMAALVIDLGFARLAQRQMQTAARSASLEGLRGEGGAMTYEERQQAAEQLIALTFDDDLNAANENSGTAFGAGPIVDFSGGAGDPSLSASQLLTVDPDNLTYKPTMQRGAETPEQFQVSLQRGGAPESAPGLFSVGPPVPYLFARGSLIDRRLIRDGIRLGADSTAFSRPAVSVGRPIVDSSSVEVYPGAIAIGYRLSDWNGARNDPRQVDSPKTMIGQEVVLGDSVALSDGYVCIVDAIGDVERVVGFAMVEEGVALPRYVAVANASARLSDVWQDIDPGIRNLVRLSNQSVDGGLLVAVARVED